jgi:hypothetical protein
VCQSGGVPQSTERFQRFNCTFSGLKLAIYSIQHSFKDEAMSLSLCPELHKQLQEQRFLHAEAYVRRSSGTLKHLTTSELAHLNNMLTGGHLDPWRLEPVNVTIPSGDTHHFNVLNNPIPQARDIVGHALDLAANGMVREAAFFLYSRLVLHHFFNDANRRTAVLATLWLVQSQGLDLDVKALSRFAIGDLREPRDLNALKDKITSLLTE